MPKYAITAKAGRRVAGRNNTGVGSILELSEQAAAFDVRAGALRPLDGAAPEPDGAGAKTLDADDLEKLTVKELEALADERGVDLPGDARKADIVAALADAD